MRKRAPVVAQFAFSVGRASARAGSSVVSPHQTVPPPRSQLACLNTASGYDWQHMELRHLRYFIGVAEEENVSRAALKLHVSQPALSRQIRDLEEELGFLLLERSAKAVRLTEAGRAFLTEARAVLQRAEDAVKAARAIATGGRGELHVD